MSVEAISSSVRDSNGDSLVLPTLPRLATSRTTTADSLAFDPVREKASVSKERHETTAGTTVDKYLISFSVWVNAISVMASSAVEDIANEMHVTVTVARIIQAGFLYGTALGAVVWTPLSEDYGRLHTHLIAVTLMALFQIPCALAANISTLISFRILAGFCSAVTFNSVGMINDMWDTKQQSWPVNVFALASEVGNEVGAVLGGYLVELIGWRWMFGVNGVVTAILLALFAVFTPETRSGVILHRRAARLRKITGEVRYYAQHEVAVRNRSVRAFLQESIFRPVYMLFREPIVLWFALFDGFNYAITYLALECLPLVYAQWGWRTGAQNLPFLGLLAGNLIAFALYHFQLRLETRSARRNGGTLLPEARLLWMLLGGLLFPISLFWFAWTSQGPPMPYVISILALGLFGIASHIIYISVSDYTVASYSLYAASAVGAQSLFRELLSGSVTLFAAPLYRNLKFQWASTLLAFIAAPMAVIPFLLYFFGPKIRAKSAFYLRIKEAEEEKEERDGQRHHSLSAPHHDAKTTDSEGRKGIDLPHHTCQSFTEAAVGSMKDVDSEIPRTLHILLSENSSQASFYSC